MDICDDQAVMEWVEDVALSHTLDLVICNAGVTDSHGPNGELEDIAKARRLVETNLIGTISLASAAATAMQRQGSGQIVMISSLAALQPLADGPAYAASKAGIVAYAEALYGHLAESCVHVGVVCPGYIRTPMAEQFKSWRPLEVSAEQAARKIIKATKHKRSFYVFPKLLHLSILLGKILPWELRRHTPKAFNYVRK
jgi:short-subunit dehydrogenase